MQRIPFFLSLLFVACIASQVSAQTNGPHFATGARVGEVRQTEAIVWVRLTKQANGDTLAIKDSASGMPGKVKLSWWPSDRPEAIQHLDPVSVDPNADFTAQIKLAGLQPSTDYGYTLTAISTTDKEGSRLQGKFKTAPTAKQVTDVTAVVVTCQGLGSVDDNQKGHWVYSEMLNHDPDLFIHTGDVVYYDRGNPKKGEPQPASKDIAGARQRWARMYSHPWNRDFNSKVASYFMKDDHDTLKDDCWPGQTYGKLNFQQGVELFKEQTPQGERPYRTVRWGKDLQFWLLEGRDFRTPNPEPDGPEKSILGVEQKSWLKKGLAQSDATFKLVVFPSPIVGPDKHGKKDNHSNPTYATEGKELRTHLASIPNTYVVCGDRHWQYASQDPETGLIEICSGPINDKHTEKGGPNFEENPDYHLYFGKGRGGFLKIAVTREKDVPKIDFIWHGDRKSKGVVTKTLSYPAK